MFMDMALRLDPLLQSSAPPRCSTAQACGDERHCTARHLEEALRAAGPALLFGLRLWASALFLGGTFFDQLAALVKIPEDGLTGVGLWN